MNQIPGKHRKLLSSKIVNATKPLPPPTRCLIDRPSLDIEKIGFLQPGKFGFMDLPIAMIAEQWTLMDCKNFLEINRSEFFDSKSERPCWKQMMSRAVLLSQWVASEVVQIVDINLRAKYFSRFTKLALKFLELNNFNGLMCVWGGLNTGPLNRLIKTKKKMSTKTQELWSALEFRLSERDDFGQLRGIIARQFKKCEPLVPWFELIDKHRNFTDQYDDIIRVPKDHNLYINFTKLYTLGEQLLTLEGYQKVIASVQLNLVSKKPRAEQFVSTIQNYLRHLPTFSEETLWKFSLQCEPTNPSK